MIFVNHREFIDARVNQKALEAGYASGSEGNNLLEIFGNQPCPCCPIHVALALRFTARASGEVVAGTQFKGMSTNIVYPPAAAARVAMRKPSHSVLPGSLM